MRKPLILLVVLVLSLPGWAKGSHASHHTGTVTHTRTSTSKHSPRTSHRRCQYYTNVDGNKVHRPVHTKDKAGPGDGAVCGRKLQFQSARAGNVFESRRRGEEIQIAAQSIFSSLFACSPTPTSLFS